MHEILFNLSGDLLALERVDEALDCVEQATEVALALYDECRERLSDGRTSEIDYNHTLKWIKGCAKGCYSYVIDTDDNILTREERYKACEAKLEALE